MFQCTYISPEGLACQETVSSEKELCFWHNPLEDKTGPDIKPRLEKKVKQGHSLCGFQLERANLDDAYLMEANLAYANLARANLEEGHLFGINLHQANLFKANLENANLKEAHLENTNLLGSNLENTNLDRVFWRADRRALSHLEADDLSRKGDPQAHQKYLEAEEIYRNIRKCYEAAGTADIAGEFFYLEMVAKRKQLRKFSGQRMWSRLVDLLCGYGEIPYRIISSSIAYILFNALVMGFLGLKYENHIYVFDHNASWNENLSHFGNALYFSVVTFTTLGYGDFAPVGWARVFAAAEAFNGAFMIALFILAFVKRMTR